MVEGDEQILDIGCGDGKVTAEIASYLKDGAIVGIDNSKQMVQLASSKYEHIKFKYMDASEIEYKDQFDIVFSNAALHWIKDHKPVVKGIYQSLNKGGKILLQMGGEGNASTILGILDTVIYSNEYNKYFQDFEFPYRFLAIQEYKQMLNDNGFNIKRVQLILKDMVHENIEAFQGWIRSTWLPYTSKLPEEKKEEFIQTITDKYIQKVPLDDNAQIHVDMVRIEIEAYK